MQRAPVHSPSIPANWGPPPDISTLEARRNIKSYQSTEGEKKVEKTSSFQFYIMNLKIIYTFLCHCDQLILSKYRTVEKQLIPKHLLSLCYLWWLQVESML